MVTTLGADWRRLKVRYRCLHSQVACVVVHGDAASFCSVLTPSRVGGPTSAAASHGVRLDPLAAGASTTACLGSS